jgi:hypothetical protein
LSVEETQLLSAIDGTRDEGALAAATGLPPGQVAEILEQLAMMGVLELAQVTGRPADGIDLDYEAREHIDQLVALLQVADYYELLALPRDADKQAVKEAYVRVGPAFHPDRHYKKNLGAYKAKIERIFATLTKAHDTLRYGKRRESYDETLGPPRPDAAAMY